MSAVAVDRSEMQEMQSFVFVVVSSFALVSVVIGLSFIHSGIGESSVSSAMSPVSCGTDGGL